MNDKDITLEDLGYECNDYSNSEDKKDKLYANYVYEIRKPLEKYNLVLFKEIAFYPNLKKVVLFYNDDFGATDDMWSIDEIQAIYNKCKDLGCLMNNEIIETRKNENETKDKLKS